MQQNQITENNDIYLGWMAGAHQVTLSLLSKNGWGESKVEKLPKSWVKIQAVEKRKAYV